MKLNQQSHRYIQANFEHQQWCKKMGEKPTIVNRITKGIQRKINDLIPDKVHKVITKTIKELIRATLYGAGYTTLKRKNFYLFEDIEDHVSKRILFYTSSSAAEGAITGFGGFISSLADFPIWLTLKMKMLFEIANSYGIDVNDYKERLYILHIFQLTFSSQQHRNTIYEAMHNWELRKDSLPTHLDEFDWKTFQLEYRDFIDLAKLLQLIPGIGAIAGAYVNHKYTKKLGINAMNAYRMRFPEFKKDILLS